MSYIQLSGRLVFFSKISFRIQVQPGHRPIIDGYGGHGRRLGPGLHPQVLRGGIVDSGLPRCSYFDTDFFGNDVGDGRGLTTGSPYACKQRCIDYDGCDFWTFRAGWERNCYLKSGDIDGEM